MKDYYRLTQSSEIMRVRRLGKSNAHPLLVLVVLATESNKPSRITVIAGKAVGGAVQRNRVKRRFRAAIQAMYLKYQPGFDVVVIARRNAIDASYQQIVSALEDLSIKSRLVKREDVRF